jgi:hypothetical protein
MSGFTVGDNVRVRDGVRYTDLCGREGVVQRVSDLIIHVSFDGFTAVPFNPRELDPVSRPYKQGDRVRVRPEILAGTHPAWPDGPLEVTRDQQPEDFYVHVRGWNGTFNQGYAMYVTDIELVEPGTTDTDDAPLAFVPQSPEKRSFHVGDWVRLKPGSPWNDRYWTKYPGEIVGWHGGDPTYYKVRFCDGDDGWHTAEGLERIAAFEDIFDDFVDPEPPETGWYAVEAPQSDGAFVTVAVEPVESDDVDARLWFRFHDADGAEFAPFAPFAEWPIELSGADCMRIRDMLWGVE